MVDSGIEPTVFFYNPNIAPKEEYEHRKKEVLRYIQKMKVPFVDADYEIDAWLEAIQGHEEDVERGERCTICFEVRLGKTAAYASEHGYRVFTTSLGISRWKDIEQVHRAGKHAASLFPELVIGTITGGLRVGRHKWTALPRKKLSIARIIAAVFIHSVNPCAGVSPKNPRTDQPADPFKLCLIIFVF